MHLLLALGYAKMKSPRIVRTCKDIPLYIYGEWKHTKTNVCIIGRNKNSIILLVQVLQKDKQNMEPEFDKMVPQLVAKGIIAFQQNNYT